MKTFILFVIILISFEANAQIENGVYKCNQMETSYFGRIYYNYMLAIDSQNITLYGWYQDNNYSDTTYFRSWMGRQDYEHLKVEEVELSKNSYFKSLMNFEKNININQYWPSEIGVLRLDESKEGKLIYHMSSGFRGSAADEVIFELVE